MRNCSVSFVIILSALAAACSDSPTSPSATSTSSPSAFTAAQLEGTWTLASIQPAGQPRQDRPDGASYSLTFADGRLSTRADCNACNSAFSIAGSTLSAGGALACTRAACPTMAFESAYTALLSGDSTTVLTNNSLTLSSSRGVLTFTR
jgi:heat shock protein HslJ